MRLFASTVLFLGGCGAAASSSASSPPSAAPPNPRIVADVRAEAAEMLGEIAQREEAFRSEYACYGASSETSASGIAHDPDPPWSPPTLPVDGESVAWALTTPGWGDIGWNPGGPVRAQLRVAVGPPGTTPPGGGPSDDFWFVAMARAQIGDRLFTWSHRSWSSEIEESSAPADSANR